MIIRANLGLDLSEFETASRAFGEALEQQGEKITGNYHVSEIPAAPDRDVSLCVFFERTRSIHNESQIRNVEAATTMLRGLAMVQKLHRVKQVVLVDCGSCAGEPLSDMSALRELLEIFGSYLSPDAAARVYTLDYPEDISSDLGISITATDTAEFRQRLLDYISGCVSQLNSSFGGEELQTYGNIPEAAIFEKLSSITRHAD